MSNGTTRAPAGCIYVCGACGKTSPTRYGFDESNRNVAMPGWDSSCATSCSLIREADIEARTASGRVTRVREGTTEVPLLQIVHAAS